MKRDAAIPAHGRPPVSPPTFEEAYPIVRRVAGARAATVARVYGLSNDERDDLEQDAALELWRKLGVFDPSRAALKTFIDRVVANQIASIARAQRAVRRTPVP